MDIIGNVRGPVLRPGDEGYDAERGGFQAFRRHEPEVIVGATGADDVRHAVAFAAAQGLPVAVLGTGHAPVAPEPGGLLITTSRMAGVRVDPERSTAVVAAGTTWAEVIDAAAAHGLAPLAGSAPHVAAVPYVLGGGLSLLSRRYGYAADHVRSLDVVTADGEPRHVTAESEPDLFWALRGGGGNLGVVTRMEIDLVPVTRLYGGGLFFDTPLLGAALRAWCRWAEDAPEEVTSSVALVPFPDVPGVPEPLRGRHVAHVRIAHLGDAASGERLVAPLRAVGPRLLDTLDELPATAVGSIYDDPKGPLPSLSGNLLLRDLDDAGVDTLLDLAGPGNPGPLIVEVRQLGGALARPPAVANAVGHRDAGYLLGFVDPLPSATPTEAEVTEVRRRQRHFEHAVAPWSTGGRFLNFLGGDGTTPEITRTAFTAADHQRLTRLKTHYDPHNLLRRNPNIPPTP
ncbi:FAD/FMN-containing dehydrogenase [Amycolatopsis arida]|uniref:FAD/FMN-containing dehydrogenase n=1 Tax=Amycolatopsis arida TaxID=587909 RepID=A0A1I5LL54_9PSEU|nr:FAD/FMN-containing dehydrogenase [Amycolatopsis arida]SFO97942.1 FAD/FMN-containing dehydrogenase [Amycolatopsis arida]